MPAIPPCLPVPARELASLLLAWYDCSRRALPWRDDPDWYRVWISEIMLQQTTVKAVLPYFEAFLRAFPNVRSLAAADEAGVLARWAGLGYYSRARNLLKAARLICTEYEGRFPADFDAAVALPGIGRYTAGAILSIAFGLPFPVLDGNVGRVMVRYLAVTDDWNARSAKLVWDLLSKLVKERAVAGRVGDFNQALMELGATICTPRNPCCLSCPLAGSCRAKRLSLQDSLPQKKRVRPLLALDYTVVLLKKEESYLMSATQSGPFPKGLWELPRIPGVPGNDAGELLEKQAGLQVEIGEALGSVVHGITHHRITIHAVCGELLGDSIPDEYAWIEPRSPGVGLSAYVRKVLELSD